MRKRSIILSVGKSCFTVCHGCYNYFSQEKDLISVTDIIYFVNFAREKYGIDKVTVAGGDPLSRPDIVELLRSIKESGQKINLDTVGTAFLSDAQLKMFGTHVVKKIDITEMVGLIDILGLPLDGSSQEICEMFRKTRPNLFDETRSILDLAEQNNFLVSINTVVHKGNLHDLNNIFEILHRHKNIFRWQMFQFMPIGVIGYVNKEKYSISEDEFNIAIESLKNHIELFPDSHIQLDPKSCSFRKNVYVMIDSNGLAWSPRSSVGSSKWNEKIDDNGERIIWGNIREKDNIATILSEAFSYV